MEKKITMADIAKLSGVGKSTVSRYFNGGYVKDETRERIQKVIDDYDYEPNAFARLNAKESNVIGVVVPTLNSKITGRVITSIDRHLRERGYTTIIKSSDHEVALEIQNMKRLARLNVDGIILSAISVTDEQEQLLKETGVPVVVLAQEYKSGVCVLDDDYGAGFTMGEYVGKRKFCNVGYIGVSGDDEAVGVVRRKGVIDGLTSCGVKNIHTVLGDYSFESGYEAAKELFSSGEQIEAVICATDRMAFGVYKYLKEKKIRIPEEVSVAGFGGYDESELLTPPLTTLKFDSYKVGTVGADTLLRMIAGEEVESKQTVGYQFIEGESVKNK